MEGAGRANKKGVDNYLFFFLSGEFFFSDSCSLIFAAFRSYIPGFHVVFARFAVLMLVGEGLGV